jgi:hypothetical protein
VKFEEAAVDALNHGFCFFWDSSLLYCYIYNRKKNIIYGAYNIYIYIYIYIKLYGWGPKNVGFVKVTVHNKL